MLKKIKGLFKSSTAVETVKKEPNISLAVTALMVEIMHIDDKLENEEHQAVVKAVKTRFGILDQDIDILIQDAHKANTNATDFHQFTSLIKDNYSTQERIAFLTDLWKIAMADGHIDHYEEHLIRRIANLIGIYHNEFIQAKIEARDSV